MHDYITIALRVVKGACGLACLYVAFLLYEDEEQRIQDKLADISEWIRKDRAAPSFLSRYIQACARLSHQALQRIFGTELFSLRSLGISLSYSVASYLTVMFFPGYSSDVLVWMTACFMSGTTAAVFTNRYTSLLALGVPIALIGERIAAAYSKSVDLGHLSASGGTFAAGVLVGCALDLAWIGFNLKLLQAASKNHRKMPMLVVVLLGATILISLLLPQARQPFSGSVYNSNVLFNLALFGDIILSTRIFTALAAIIFLLSIVSVSIYWCFGPLIARLLSSAKRHSIIRAHKSFGVLGAELLRSAVTDTTSFHWVSEAINLIEKISGG